MGSLGETKTLPDLSLFLQVLSPAPSAFIHSIHRVYQVWVWKWSAEIEKEQSLTGKQGITNSSKRGPKGGSPRHC